jgi:hypothetical protein
MSAFDNTDVDIDGTLAPKSDQLDAIELVDPRTITIRAVTAGSADQPVNVWFDGDGGRPWRPSKTVRRILRECWGKRGSDWVGRSCTIYNDKTVKFGGLEIGGVRVSHASGIGHPITMLLPVTRGKFAKHTIQPLKMPKQPPATARPPLDLAPATENDAAFSAVIAAINAAADTDQLAEIVADADMDRFTESQRNTARELYVERRDALSV